MLTPGNLKIMVDIEPGRFEDMVGAALDGLPEDIGRQICNVAVTVDNWGREPRGALGTYRGFPAVERGQHPGIGSNYVPLPPDQITIYRTAICEICGSEEEVAEQVRRVVIHEVGHYFGIGDDRLCELGW